MRAAPLVSAQLASSPFALVFQLVGARGARDWPPFAPDQTHLSDCHPVPASLSRPNKVRGTQILNTTELFFFSPLVLIEPVIDGDGYALTPFFFFLARGTVIIFRDVGSC